MGGRKVFFHWPFAKPRWILAGTRSGDSVTKFDAKFVIIFDSRAGQKSEERLWYRQKTKPALWPDQTTFTTGGDRP
jgi:hypothetical protein